LTDSIFCVPFFLAGIVSGKLGFKTQIESNRPVFRKGFVVDDGLGIQVIRYLAENLANRMAKVILAHHQVHFDFPNTLPRYNNS
jgi:hypothetical protein